VTEPTEDITIQPASVEVAMQSKAKHQGLVARLRKGFGATALVPVVTALIQFGTVPLLLKAWGGNIYGDWLVLSAIPGYLNLSNLGFGDASGSDMTIRVAAHDYEGALKTFQSSWALLLIISFLVVTPLLFLVWIAPWSHWLHLTGMSNAEAAGTILFLSIYVIVTQQCGIIESGFRCDGNYALGTSTMTAIRLGEAICATAIGVFTGRVLYVALSYLIFRVIGTIVYAAILRRKSPWLSIGVSKAEVKVIRDLLRPALGFVALPLGYAISLQGFTILIGIVLGPLAVASFSTLRTLARVGFQLLNVVGWTMWPEMSRAFGESNLKLARVLHRRGYQLGLLLSSANLAIFWFLGQPIYHLWLHDSVHFDERCFHTLLLVTFSSSLWFISSIVPMSTNTHNKIAFAFVTGSVIALLMSWILLKMMNIEGAALSLLVIDCIMICLVSRTALQQLQETPWSFLLSILGKPLPEVGTRTY
jgi:O-antigen/teichoic acid export membrane protein